MDVQSRGDGPRVPVRGEDREPTQDLLRSEPVTGGGEVSGSDGCASVL
jgi:hypothetical protein